MRKTSNFHPEWGYLAPAPSFIRTARLVLLATAVGATLGAGAVFSRASHQATEPSVAARTLVHPPEAGSAGAEPLGLPPGEHYKRRSWGGYYGDTGGSYRNWW